MLSTCRVRYFDGQEKEYWLDLKGKGMVVDDRCLLIVVAMQ